MNREDLNSFGEANKPICLNIQFTFEDKAGGVMKKDLMLEIDPTINNDFHDTNQFRLINNVTAAILKIFGGSNTLPGRKNIHESTSYSKKVKNSLKSFTPRQLEVLDCVLSGASNQQISDDLCISVNTVKFHITNILEKLNVENRVELMAKFNDLGAKK